jgi:CheY-like chemotaxis protein
MVFNRFAPGVLLVDDSNLILNNFSRLLAAEGYRVLIARNGLEALNVLRNSTQPNHPNGPIHAVITDLEMPQMDGLSFLREVRNEARFNKIPIYLHTSLSDANSKQKGEKLGANGFFVKNDVVNIMDTLKSYFQSTKVTA